MKNIQDPILEFSKERRENIVALQNDVVFNQISQEWLKMSMERRYVYNFDWLGRPIIQYPQDMVAIQELIWKVKPDLIIETGIAHGGSLILSASLLALLDMAEAIEQGISFNPRCSKRKVIGIDIDIRSHNRKAIEEHPFSSRIEMVEGSSVDLETILKVNTLSKEYSKIMVFLDSMHTHDHVLAELNAYGNLVSKGSYCVVFDTFVENMPEKFFADRPWDVGNNPMTAVKEWLPENPQFVLDKELESKLAVTVAANGFLYRKG